MCGFGIKVGNAGMVWSIKEDLGSVMFSRLGMCRVCEGRGVVKEE